MRPLLATIEKGWQSMGKEVCVVGKELLFILYRRKREEKKTEFKEDGGF